MMSETILKRGFLAAAALLAFLVVPSTPAAAQVTEGSWRAFTGCWETLDVPRPPTVCVVPTADFATVEIVTVAEGAIVERERIEATGQRITRAREGCTGWESAEWSADGKRLYMEAEHRCEGGIERSSHGIMSILPGGDWLNVQGVEVAGNTGVRVLRHRATEPPAIVRGELDPTVVGREFALDASRVAISAPVKLPEVVEVSHRLPEPVVEAWLIETEQSFQMDRDKLRQLADAGVPGSVIDVMVALSYPNVFAIDRTARRLEMQAAEAAYARGAGPYAGVYSPWFGRSPFGFGPYSAFGNHRWGYSPYGMHPGYGYGWYPSRPTVIVIREPAEPPQPQARLVRGRGYTQGSSSGSSNSVGRSGTSSSGSSAATSSSSGSSSTSSTTSTSSGSSSSGGRTAQPRQ